MPTIDDILADFRSLGDLDKLAIVSDRGFIKLRIGFVVTMFFTNGNTLEKRLAFTEILRHYYSVFENTVTHYTRTDTGRLTRIKDADFLDEYKDRARREMADDAGNPDINHFGADLVGFADKERESDPPFYYCGGTCLPISEWFPPESVSYLDAHIPASWVEQNGYLALAELVRHWCGILEPIHGTAGLGTLFDQSSRRTTSGLIAFPLVKRFVGLDYNDSAAWRAKSKRARSRVIRTTNWLSILDDGFAAQLGGLAKLTDALGPACPIHPYPGGVIMQAGPQAELGDANHRLIPEHYRTVARALKPLRFEAYRTGLLEVPAPLDSLDETKAWIARFD